MKKAILAGVLVIFSAPALSSTPEDQTVRNIVQGVYIERDYDMTLGREERTTYRIGHSNGNLMVVAGDRALPGVEFYSVSPDERVVNFWVMEGGERGLATMKRLLDVVRMTMPSGERRRLEYVRQITEHDDRALFRGVIHDHVDSSLLDEYERLVYDEGLTMDEAYARLEGTTAPSYDCGAELTDIEQMICHSDELSGLDMEMSKTYQKAMSEGFADEKVDISSDQMEWLDKRNECSDVGCLRDAYYERLDTLGGFLHSITRTPGGMKMD